MAANGLSAKMKQMHTSEDKGQEGKTGIGGYAGT
jgi:hypothetical protein